MRKKEIIVHCKTCNKKLVRCPSTVKETNFCNHSCYSIEKQKKWANKKNPRWAGGSLENNCLVCNKFFTTKRYGKVRNSKLCSLECYYIHRSNTYRGSNHPNWRNAGGRTTKPIRSMKAYKIWRLDIFKRDNYKCVECGAIEKLHIHHNQNLAKIVSDIKEKNGELIFTDKRLFDVNNGKTLCIKCHREQHKKMGRIAGTPIKNGRLDNQQPSFGEVRRRFRD